MEDMSVVDPVETGLELSMQELEPMDAPFWGTLVEGVAIGVAVGTLLT